MLLFFSLSYFLAFSLLELLLFSLFWISWLLLALLLLSLSWVFLFSSLIFLSSFPFSLVLSFWLSSFWFLVFSTSAFNAKIFSHSALFISINFFCSLRSFTFSENSAKSFLYCLFFSSRTLNSALVDSRRSASWSAVSFNFSSFSSSFSHSLFFWLNAAFSWLNIAISFSRFIRFWFNSRLESSNLDFSWRNW